MSIAREQPRRIQRRRTKGWRLPPNTVCVTRGTRWGNPFVVGRDGDVHECLRRYAGLMLPFSHAGDSSPEARHTNEANLADMQQMLRGKNLACWCPLFDADGRPAPCHADLLLAWANEDIVHDRRLLRHRGRQTAGSSERTTGSTPR